MPTNRNIISKAKKASPEQYVASSIIRFGRLRDYIQEKILVDFFAIKGNQKMVEGIELYIREQLPALRKKKKIRILDIGPAVGALSGMLCLQSLNKFGLLKKTQLHMIDVSENVINLTQECNFFYPTSLLEPELKTAIFQKLRNSKTAIQSAEKLPWKDNYFDIITVGFVFHHLHDDVKPFVAQEIERALAPGGMVAVGEEWFENYQEYAQKHKDDEISLAYEAIICYEDLVELFPKLKIFYTYDKENETNSYAFCASKPEL